MRDNFGESLKLRRRKAGLTQEQLADKLEVTPKTVIAWEKGHVAPHGANLARLNQILQEKVTSESNMNTTSQELLFRQTLDVLETIMAQNSRTLDQSEAHAKRYEAMAEGRIAGLEQDKVDLRKDKSDLYAKNSTLENRLVEQNTQLMQLLAAHMKAANNAQ